MNDDTDVTKLSSIFARIGASSVLVAQFIRPLSPLRSVLLIVSGVFLIAAVVLFVRFPRQTMYGNVGPSSGFGDGYGFQNAQRCPQPFAYPGEERDAMERIQRFCLVIMVGLLIVMFVVMEVLPMSFEDRHPIMTGTMTIGGIVSLLMAPCILRPLLRARRLGQQPAASVYLSSVVGMLLMVIAGIAFLVCSIYL